MRVLHLAVFATIALGASTMAAYAQNAVTATCKDGSSWSGASRSGACRGHGGVQAFGAAATTSIPASTAPAQTMAPGPNTAAGTPMQAAPNSGAGQVWVNTSSKVYHCPTDRYYGKTKHGTYMTESAAKAAGDRPDHGKACGLS